MTQTESPTLFPPTMQAARARLLPIKPGHYASTRNHLDGAVTLISPYLTHGFINLQDVVNTIRTRNVLKPEEKLMMEFGWREFFQHVWAHLGEGIFNDQRPAISSATYVLTVPDDIRSGATGIPVIDQSVRTLYATGYLHNHARMWLASYVVHLRKVHWRVAADWMVGHLLDGDLASNHLSWQWVAGTFSTKPYLFNAQNVAAYAPKATHAAWLSAGTQIDQSYEILDAIARGSDSIAPEPGVHAAIAEPAVYAVPPDLATSELPSLARRSVELVHPWNLGENDEPGYRLGVIHLPFHARFPWSAKRWAFVLERMRASCDTIFVGDLNDLVPLLENARTGTTVTLNPGYTDVLQKLVDEQRAVRTLFTPPETMSTSFSQFYEKVSGITLTRKAPPRESTKINTHKQGRRHGSRR